MLTITDKSVNIAFRYLTFIFTNLLKKKMFVASSNVSSGALKIGWDFGAKPPDKKVFGSQGDVCRPPEWPMVNNKCARHQTALW